MSEQKKPEVLGEYTPVEPETGIALHIYVTPEDFAVRKNRQHHKEHPSRREELRDYAGRALRFSSTQQLPDHFHMGGYKGSYHNIFWGPEIMPQTSRAKITKALLNVGRVIPREAIVLTGDGWEKKSLSDKEHTFLSHPSLTHVEGRTERSRLSKQNRIGHALITFALEQELEDVASKKVKQEFLNTVDRKRERELGNFMIQSAVDQAISPVAVLYESAKKQGMVSSVHVGIREVLGNLITPAQDYPNYYELLHKKLSVAEGIEAPALQTGVDTVELAAA